VATGNLATATYSGDRGYDIYIQWRQEIWQQLHTVATGDMKTATYSGDKRSDNSYKQWRQEN